MIVVVAAVVHLLVNLLVRTGPCGRATRRPRAVRRNAALGGQGADQR
ncbi:hypothetical protein OG920_13405 [Streptomyces europaeiscabiei]